MGSNMSDTGKLPGILVPVTVTVLWEGYEIGFVSLFFDVYILDL